MKLLIGWLLGMMFTGFGCALFREPRAVQHRSRAPRRRLYVEDLRREEGWM